jgi:hypothetical protein
MQCTNLFTVLQAQKIADANDQKIKETLIKIFLLVGLRQQHYPNEMAITFIVNYLRNTLGHKTIDELYLAFELAVQNKLDVEDVNVYDQFSIVFLEKIMQSYKKWLYKQSEENQVKPVQIENKVEIDKLAEVEEWEQKTELNMHFIPLYLYDYLIELGKISLTAKEKWDYYNKAIQVKTDQLKQDISNRKDLKHFLNMVQDGLLGAEKQSIINLSKRMIIYDYLKSKKFP